MARKTPAEAQPGPDFETSLAELESLVERLERGDLQLEDALSSFERGVALTRQCQSSLASAQQKVEVLLREGATPTEFNADVGAGDPADE
jgi:exodeoxyribonuclease VII small subunit